jgi:hypothetical protein
MRRVGTVVIGGLGGLSGLALLIASIVGLRIAIEVLMDLLTHSRGINWPVAAGIFAADVVVFCVALLTLRWAFKVLWPAKMTPVYASVAEAPEVQEAFRREVRALLTEVGVISLDAEGSVFPVGEAVLVSQNLLGRIRQSAETTGAGLEQEVKRQYVHECGHIGVGANNGLVAGDGVALADQILREAMGMNGWDSMDGTERAEAVKRGFYLAWRNVLGLKGEPDTKPFGERCCGFARAMGELIPGFPSEDSVVNPPSEEGVTAREDGAPDRAERTASAFSASGSVAKENSTKHRDAGVPFEVHNDHIRIVGVAPIPTDYDSFVQAMESLGFRRNALWGNSLMTLARNEFVACETLIPGAGANTENVLQRTVCHALRSVGMTGQVEISVSARMYHLGRDPASAQKSEPTRGMLQEVVHRHRSEEDERPDYFVAPASAEDAVRRRIKGNFRRQMIARSIRNEGLVSIPELWCAQDISESFKEILTSTAGPRARGGEDLPDLAENEVEVARLTLADSVHGEVTSFRAKRDPRDGGILLSMVDEYDTEFKLQKNKVPASLTAEEVLAAFRNADPTPLATSCKVEFSSFFYPNLDLVHEGRAQQQESTSKTQEAPASDESASRATDPENGEGFGEHSYDAAQMTEKLQAKAAWADKNREAALKEPCHLFFLRAVDRDGVNRFFDIMEQNGDFSVAETARGAPRLGQCTETSYKSPDGTMHHVHRNYGKYRNVTLHQAIQYFAGMYGLASLAEIAETHNHLEASPTWDMIFARLGCRAGTFVPGAVTQHLDRPTEASERTGTSTPTDARGSMLDFDKMTPVAADAELAEGFVRIIMPNGKCVDILEELWTEARRMEPGCVVVSHKATGTKQN